MPITQSIPTAPAPDVNGRLLPEDSMPTARGYKFRRLPLILGAISDFPAVSFPPEMKWAMQKRSRRSRAIQVQNQTNPQNPSLFGSSGDSKDTLLDGFFFNMMSKGEKANNGSSSSSSSSKDRR
ncbi:hypothetical protein NE237_019719 [Protea cynaroides]|uniref:Uncharacterized protein n=1 Tax=Protea cynaroides TaxID=273540 RepID=A0A9Q0K0Z5_9MAGN|nr:hypothetical protein NE237_019719 [Protea cynaroides]